MTEPEINITINYGVDKDEDFGKWCRRKVEFRNAVQEALEEANRECARRHRRMR